MDHNYNLLVLRWSIFTLTLRLMTCSSVQASQIIVEQLCPKESLSRRIDSSLTLELRPNSYEGSCKQILEAPESHGFYVRLHSSGGGANKAAGGSTSSGSSAKNMNGDVPKIRNATATSGSCPLTIYQTRAKSVQPWRIDPCQLEANNGPSVGEAVASKFLESPLRIIWNHGGNMPNYRLSITTYGKGEVCEEEGRHSCLKMGQEKHICIAGDLICDGVQHCPEGSEFESDENAELCELVDRRRHTWPIHVFKEFLRNSLQKSFPSLRVPEGGGGSGGLIGSPVELGAGGSGSGGAAAESLPFPKYNETLIVETVITSDSTATIRKNFSRGLSKYGPWGYLMLGMLLCGGALLICGLWECCCRKQKPTMPMADQSVMDVHVISTEVFAAGQTTNRTLAQQQSQLQQQQAAMNYNPNEDPPPSYNVLFPNNKSTEDLSQMACSVAGMASASTISRSQSIAEAISQQPSPI